MVARLTLNQEYTPHPNTHPHTPPPNDYLVYCHPIERTHHQAVHSQRWYNSWDGCEVCRSLSDSGWTLSLLPLLGCNNKHTIAKLFHLCLWKMKNPDKFSTCDYTMESTPCPFCAGCATELIYQTDLINIQLFNFLKIAISKQTS